MKSMQMTGLSSCKNEFMAVALKKREAPGMRLLLALCLALAALLMSNPAAATVAVTPSTWDIIGLDSNSPASGPSSFPVGAKITGGPANGTGTATLVWESGGSADGATYIYERTGTSLTVNLNFDGAGSADAYFEVEVKKDPAAYYKTRRYHISSGGVNSVTRELYVEKLVSQGRNAITDMKVGTTLAGLASIPNGGSMSLVKGNSYYIQLIGYTATSGYEQLESFINFNNTLIRIDSVNMTGDAASPISSPTPYLYADACLWESDPLSPYNRSCTSSGKFGGNITVTYKITVLEVGSGSQQLNSLIHDFSGSSFHYNADYSTTARIMYLIDPTTVNITKSFFPNPTNKGGVSSLTFTLTNPNPGAVSGLEFTDVFPTAPAAPNGPGAMTLYNTVTTNTCGGTLKNSNDSSLTSGDAGIKLSGGTVAANSSCIVQVNITPASTGTYTNSSEYLLVNSVSTGKKAVADLTVDTTPLPPSPPSTCTSPVKIAEWTFEAPLGAGTNAAPNPSYKAVDVSSATANWIGTSCDTSNAYIDTAQFYTGTQSWATKCHTTSGSANATTQAYMNFVVDTGKYGGASISFRAFTVGGSWGGTNALYYYSDPTNGGTGLTSASTPILATTVVPSSWTTYKIGTTSYSQPFTGAATTTGPAYTTFRINAAGSKSNPPGWSALNLDDVVISGCPTPLPPTITKTFVTNPLAVGGTTDLNFTITNPNSCCALSGIAFSDTLPQNNLQGTVAVNNGSPTVTGAGTAFKTQLVPGSIVFIAGVYSTVNTISSDTQMTLTAGYTGTTNLNAPITAGLTLSSNAAASQCNGGSVTGASGTRAVSLASGTLAAAASCTVTVSVKDSIAGPVNNVSDKVSATESGANNGSTGIAKDTLSAVIPPIITKSFNPNSILNGSSSTLTFTIYNPNQNNSLSGVAFSDTLPVNNLTGTVTTNGTVNVTGTGTAFQSDLIPGSIININGSAYTVATITSNTALTLTTTAAGSGTYTATAGITLTGAPTNDATYSCGGTLSGAAGGRTLSLASGTVPAGSFCKVSAQVKGSIIGELTNTSGSVSAAIAGTGNTATDKLKVTEAHPAISLLKQAGLSATGPWLDYIAVPATSTGVYYRFTVENPGDVDLSNVYVKDPPTGATVTGCNWATLAKYATQTCTTGPVTVVSGSPQMNEARAYGSYGATLVTDDDYAFYATSGLSITKNAMETYFTDTGNTLHYSFTVTNTGAAILDGPITVTDTVTSVTPNVAVPVTCPSLTGVGDLDDLFDPGESVTCSATYTVTAADKNAQLVTNVAHASSAASGSIPAVISGNATRTIPVATDLTAMKTNNVGGITASSSFIWTVTVRNSTSGNSATFANGQQILTDDLPTSGATYSLGSVTKAGVSGSISCSIASNTLNCTAGGGSVTFPAAITGTIGVTNNSATVSGSGTTFTTQLTANSVMIIAGVPYSVKTIESDTALTLTGNYTGTTASGLYVPGSFSVPITVTVTSMGTLANPKSGGICKADPGGVITETNTANNDCADSVTVHAQPDLTIVKTADPTAAKPGEIITYTVRVDNTGGTATVVTLTDKVSRYSALRLKYDNTGSTPFDFTDRTFPNSSGLTLNPGGTISYSSNNGADFSHPLTDQGDGYDGTVTNWMIVFSGTMNKGDSGFTLKYQMKVK